MKKRMPPEGTHVDLAAEAAEAETPDAPASLDGAASDSPSESTRREDDPPVPEDRPFPAGAPREEGPRARGTEVYFVGEGEDDEGFSSNPVRFTLHAVFYCAGKVADKIVSLYTRTFRLDREYVADFNRSTGIAHANRGDWGKAIPMLEKALAIAPDDQKTRMRLAEACYAADQHERAHEHLKEILNVNPDSARALRALGIHHARKQDYEQAIKYLGRAVKLAPDHAQSFYRLGAAYDNKKLYEDAVRSFKDAIRLDPRFSKAYQALGFTYESMGDRTLAVECFKKALELE